VARSRAATLGVAVALVAVLSLNWFAFAPRAVPPTAEQSESGILNLLHVYPADGFHASGWAGLGWLTVALLGLAVVGVVAGLRLPAVIVAAVALAALVLDLAAEDEGVVVRWWPASVAIALSAALLACAVWAWRARVGQGA
jgi:hypothetical protein